MDKNLVNIDDLVRQRLMGGEEQERAGAWLRMSELLEKEMPKARPIAFPWRRIFGAGAVLLLLGALSLGGYEMNAYVHRGNTDVTNTAMIAAIPNGTSAGSTSTNISTTSANTSTNTNTIAKTDNNATDNNNTNDNNNINNTSNRQSNHQSASSSNKINATSNNINTTQVAENSVTNNDTKAIAANSNNSDKKSSRHLHNHTSTALAGTSVAATASEKVSPATADNKNASPDNSSNSKSTAVRTVKHTGTTENNVGTPVKNDVAVNAPEKTADVTKSSDGEAGNTTTTIARAHKPHHIKKAHSGIAKTTAVVSKDDLVLSSSAPKADVNDEAVARTHKPAVGSPVKSSSTTAVNNKSGVVKNSAIAKTHKPATAAPAKNTSGATVVSGSSGAVKSSAVAKAAKKAATTPVATKTAKKNNDATAAVTKKANNKRAAKTTGTGVAGNDDNAVADASAKPQREQRTIHRMVVQERLMHTTPFDATYHFDTISLGNITEEYDLPATVFGAKPKSDRKAGDELAANASSTPESAPAAATKPAKSSTDEESSSMKDNSQNKKSLGQRTVENLSAAFNDIKMQAGRAQFAAGITGGINGTFLGPNNFKGFQFGVTGKFTFSDAVAIMGELKYFHRINNGYTLNDNYYDYTAVPGGYSKQLVEVPYGISTLHSIELPLTVRYCISNFNFFVGGNFAYMFAINTGDYPTTPTGVTPTFAQSIGNDNQPKIKANDFNSRFGIGYTFGVSYQVSPKVTLDLREVQTFWDNAKTDGAKYISSQLYKSPSFQLSLGYRFGGAKKDKE